MMWFDSTVVNSLLAGLRTRCGTIHKPPAVEKHRESPDSGRQMFSPYTKITDLKDECFLLVSDSFSSSPVSCAGILMIATEHEP